MAEVHLVNYLHVRYTYLVPYWPTAFSNLSPLLKTDDIRPSESLHAMQHTPVDPASTRLVLIDNPSPSYLVGSRLPCCQKKLSLAMSSALCTLLVMNRIMSVGGNSPLQPPRLTLSASIPHVAYVAHGVCDASSSSSDYHIRHSPSVPQYNHHHIRQPPSVP